MKDKKTELKMNLYDMNKAFIVNQNTLTSNDIYNQIDKYITAFWLDSPCKYFMLLCREQYDFTLFDFKSNEKTIFSISKANKELYECLKNRGEIKSIELTEKKDAIEIWLAVDKEAFCYYLFPYDAGVIEI